MGDGAAPSLEWINASNPRMDIAKGHIPPSTETIEYIFNSLDFPLNVKLRDPLTPELMQARLVLKHLKVKETMPKSVPFDDDSMRSLRQMAVPTKEVHTVIMAFFLLLGELEDRTKVNPIEFYSIGQ